MHGSCSLRHLRRRASRPTKWYVQCKRRYIQWIGIFQIREACIWFNITCIIGVQPQWANASVAPDDEHGIPVFDDIAPSRRWYDLVDGRRVPHYRYGMPRLHGKVLPPLPLPPTLYM